MAGCQDPPGRPPIPTGCASGGLTPTLQRTALWRSSPGWGPTRRGYFGKRHLEVWQAVGSDRLARWGQWSG